MQGYNIVCFTFSANFFERPSRMNILVLPGDDIGPEITAAALKVLERANTVYSLGLTCVQREAVVAHLEKSAERLAQTV